MTTRVGSCAELLVEPLRGRREGASGRSGPGPAAGVGVALGQEGGALFAVADGGTDPGAGHHGGAARADDRTDDEGGTGSAGGGRREGEGGGDATAVDEPAIDDQILDDEEKGEQDGAQQLPETLTRHGPLPYSYGCAPRYTGSRGCVAVSVAQTTSRWLELYSGVQVVRVR